MLLDGEAQQGLEDEGQKLSGQGAPALLLRSCPAWEPGRAVLLLLLLLMGWSSWSLRWLAGDLVA